MGMGFHTPWSSHPSSRTSPAWPWGHRIANMEDAIQRSSRAVQNDDDTKRGSTNPVLLKPWCFLGNGGLKEPGWELDELVCFICCKIWSQANLICVNYVVVRFLDKFMIHIIILRYFGQNDLVPSYFQHLCWYAWRSKTEQVNRICWVETLAPKQGT